GVWPRAAVARSRIESGTGMEHLSSAGGTGWSTTTEGNAHGDVLLPGTAMGRRSPTSPGTAHHEGVTATAPPSRLLLATKDGRTPLQAHGTCHPSRQELPCPASSPQIWSSGSPPPALRESPTLPVST